MSEIAFYDRMLKKFGRKKTEEITRLILSLLRWTARDKSWNCNHPDYANAFGVLQGVSIALGYEDVGANNVKTSPRYWFDQVLEEAKVSVRLPATSDSPLIGQRSSE